MRRKAVVAVAALIAAFALAGLASPVGSRSPSTPQGLGPAAFTTVTVPADLPDQDAAGLLDASLRSDGFLDPGASLVEPGRTPKIPTKRTRVDQPGAPSGEVWKPPLYTISGWATFYDNGTTAMRMPRGTVVRICGDGGCIERTVNDYGPIKKVRIVDLYRPDFFQICGCPWWSGEVWVTVSIY